MAPKGYARSATGAFETSKKDELMYKSRAVAIRDGFWIASIGSALFTTKELPNRGSLAICVGIQYDSIGLGIKSLLLA